MGPKSPIERIRVQETTSSFLELDTGDEITCGHESLEERTRRRLRVENAEDRSEKEEDSIEKRKQESVQYATNQALNGLFPKNATNSVASVSTVSKMEKEPEVYIMSSDDKEVRALVVISYSVSIAGSEAQKGTFMYKVTFEPQQEKFTSIKNLGEVNLM